MARVKVRIQYVGDAWDEHDITARVGLLLESIFEQKCAIGLDDGSLFWVNWANVRSIRVTELDE